MNSSKFNRAYSHAHRQILAAQQLKKADMPYIAVCGLTALYLSFSQPVMMCAVAVMSALAIVLSQGAKAIPSLEKRFRLRIRFWHVAALIMTVAALFGLLEAPAHAQFLTGLETAVTTVVTDSGSGIDATVITLIFNTIRVVFLLLVVSAGIFAYNQAQQGNDWRPIITQMALGIAVVLAIDVLTRLFVSTPAA
jgi:hypothetical protein